MLQINANINTRDEPHTGELTMPVHTDHRLIRPDGQYATEWMRCSCGSLVHDTTTTYTDDTGKRYHGHHAWCTATGTHLGQIT